MAKRLSPANTGKKQVRNEFLQSIKDLIKQVNLDLKSMLVLIFLRGKFRAGLS